MVEYAQQVWGADTRSFGQNYDASPWIAGNFLGRPARTALAGG
jgi:hypothetical protein